MSEPLWLTEAPPTPWPQVTDARCELLIVGAGISGLSAACAAQERGLDVLVVDRAAPGTGASGRNAGFVLLAHVFELAQIAAQRGEAVIPELIALARENHARLRERHGSAAALVDAGSLMVSIEGEDAEAAALERAAQLLRESGVAAELGAPHPALRGFGLQLSIAEDGQLHPGRLMASMASTIARGGTAAVVRIDDGEAVLEGGGAIRFERALVATNAHVAQLVPALRGIVTPHRAQMLATTPLAARVLEPVVYANWGYDYFRQRDDGSLLLGGRRHLFKDVEATDVAEPSDAVQAALDAYLEEHLPFARGAEIAARWAGIMGFSPDELPLLGPAPGLSRVDVLAGFTGHGLGLATALAALWVDRATNRAGVDAERRAAIFDAGRFQAALASGS